MGRGAITTTTSLLSSNDDGRENLRPTYSWADNPWVEDRRGKVLAARAYAKIKPSAIAELALHRVGVQTYSFVIPPAGRDMHFQLKMRRWGIAILLSAPELIVGGWMHVEKTLCQRHPPDLEQAMSGNPFRLVAFEGSATVRSPNNGV